MSRPDRSKSHLSQTIVAIESVLVKTYGDEAMVVACDFLLSQDGATEARGGEDGPRAALYIDEGADEIHLGLHFSSEIAAKLDAHPPSAGLTSKNLDVFCVVVEEVSHLRLVSDRAHKNQSVSQIELEWQAEVDKVWVAATLLFQQCGDPHLLPLTRMIFDCAITTASESHHQRYEEATHRAASLWYSLLACATSERELVDSSATRALFRTLYSLGWAEKTSLVDRMTHTRSHLKRALAA